MAFKTYILKNKQVIEVADEKHLASISGCKWFEGAIEVINEAKSAVEPTKDNEEPVTGGVEVKKRSKKTK